MTHSRLQQLQVCLELCLLCEALIYSLKMQQNLDRFFWLDTAVLYEKHIQPKLISWIWLHNRQGFELRCEHRVTLKEMGFADKASHVRSDSCLSVLHLNVCMPRPGPLSTVDGRVREWCDVRTGRRGSHSGKRAQIFPEQKVRNIPAVPAGSLLQSLTTSCVCCSPHVSFCGYSIPHPAEALVNIRVQTTGEIDCHATRVLSQYSVATDHTLAVLARIGNSLQETF